MANDDGYDVSVFYGYEPSTAAAIVFTIAYGLSALLHELQYRTSRPQKFTIPLTMGAVFSTIGYGNRTLNIFNIGDPSTTFLVSYMFILGAGPTYAGANYFIGGRLFAFLPGAAPISPLYTVRTFLFFDFCAEILVWVGSSQVASAASDDGPTNQTQQDLGKNLVRVAMILQAILFIAFTFCLILFASRFRRVKAHWKIDGHKGSKATIKIIVTLLISSLLILVRSLYHIIEAFVPGRNWIHREIAFIIFEALIMLLNVGMFNIINPGHTLPIDSRVYIDTAGEERVSDATGGALTDTRPLGQKILDPLDIKGLLRKRKGPESSAEPLMPLPNVPAYEPQSGC